MQAARHLVGVLVELSAGMELRHDDFGGRDAFAFVDLGRDAAPVVLDSDRAVGVQVTVISSQIAGERLVDRVVHDLVDHVVQARAVVGVADIHARPLAHRIEALQHLDRFRAVLGGSSASLLFEAVVILVPWKSVFGVLADAAQMPHRLSRPRSYPDSRQDLRFLSENGCERVAVGLPVIQAWREGQNLAKQGASARVVEMGRDLVEKDEGGGPGKRRDELGLGENEADEESLLLAGGALRGRHFGAVNDNKVAQMRSFKGSAAALSRSRPSSRRAPRNIVLDFDRRALPSAGFERAFERDRGPEEGPSPARHRMRSTKPASRAIASSLAAAIATPASAICSSRPANKAASPRASGTGGSAGAWRGRSGPRGSSSRDRWRASAGREKRAALGAGPVNSPSISGISQTSCT